jgi:hypothetical protein
MSARPANWMSSACFPEQHGAEGKALHMNGAKGQENHVIAQIADV